MMDIFDPISDDLSKYQVTSVLSPELWERFNYGGTNADYTKWKKGKMFDGTGDLHSDVNSIPSDCGGIYAYAIVTPDIIPNCVSAKFWGVVDEKSGESPGSLLIFINAAFLNYRTPGC